MFKRVRNETGAAMIIAIFAMLFFFGVTTIIFSNAFGEQSRSVNALSKQRASEAAWTGVDQGTQNTNNNRLNPLNGSNINTTYGISGKTCTDGTGTPVWVNLSNTTSEQNAGQKPAYCYAVLCPVALSAGACPNVGSSIERTIQALGRVQNYNRAGTGSPGATSYTYAFASRIIVLP